MKWARVTHTSAPPVDGGINAPNDNPNGLSASGAVLIKLRGATVPARSAAAANGDVTDSAGDAANDAPVLPFGVVPLVSLLIEVTYTASTHTHMVSRTELYDDEYTDIVVQVAQIC